MARIGFIGAGNMAQALIVSLLAKRNDRIIASDRNENQLKKLSVKTTVSNKEVVKKSDIIFLAIKPQQTREVLEEIRGEIKDKIIVSIAAGITIAKIESIIGKKKIIRVMPNTPCLVGEMAAGFSASKEVTKKDVDKVKEILSAGGKSFQLPEELLDAVTGLSGSGPAFVAYLIQAFAEAGIKEKLPKEVSYQLAIQTFLGTAKLLQEKQISPDELIAMVSSPNGTTIAGREILEKSEIKKIMERTIARATERSKELGK